MPDVQPDPTAPTVSPTATPITATSTPPEWRVPETDPRPWARGKTATELLTLSDQLVTGLQQVATSQYQPPYSPPPAPVSSGVNWQDLKDDDVVDGKTIKHLATQFQAAIANPNQGSAGQVARLNYESVKRDPSRADIFQKYEPEILRELAGLQPAAWTLDNLGIVADVIASRHVREIAKKMAETEMANMQGLPIRGNGLGSASVSMESDGLPTNWQDILQKKNVSLEQVRGFCASQGWSIKKWFEEEGKMHVVAG